MDLDQALETLYIAHFCGKLAPLAEIFTRTIGEIGDLGIGIPDHLRRAIPDLGDDESAIREATKEGVSGTGDAMRGLGYQEVINALKETQVAFGELRVWSGYGRFRVETSGGRQLRRRAWMVDSQTQGTWVRVELAG